MPTQYLNSSPHLCSIQSPCPMLCSDWSLLRPFERVPVGSRNRESGLWIPENLEFWLSIPVEPQLRVPTKRNEIFVCLCMYICCVCTDYLSVFMCVHVCRPSYQNPCVCLWCLYLYLSVFVCVAFIQMKMVWYAGDIAAHRQTATHRHTDRQPQPAIQTARPKNNQICLE